MVDIKDKELKDDSHVAISTRNLVPYRRSATPWRVLHICTNGDVVLCCQDWKKETLFVKDVH